MLSFIKQRASALAILACLQHLPVVLATQQVKCNGQKYTVDSVITRDVAIIGGGSAGTYSAIRLHDLGKSVAVIEAKDHLGGHTHTYTDPVTGATIDYGVQVWHPIDVVTNYFARLNVSAGVNTDHGPPGVVAENMDFRTGKLDLDPTVNKDFVPALLNWTSLVLKFPYLDYGFDLPDPVPEDLLMNFGDFAKKYHIEGLFPYAYFFTQGVGDILNQPTIYVMKAFGINDILNLQTGFLTTTAHDNSALYRAAAGVLGENVLYGSNIVAVHRDSKKGSSVIVKSGGKTILVQSTKLIIAIQPTLDNLAFLDLTHQEKHLFRSWKSSQYITGLIRNSGIPDNTTLNNIAPGALLQVPPPPSLYQIGQTGVPGLQVTYYIDTGKTSDAQIKKNMLDIVKKADVVGKGPSDPVFVAYDNHKPFTLWVDRKKIKHGFYKDLYSLQGKQNSWYISASMHTHDSSLIWRYAEGLLADIAK